MTIEDMILFDILTTCKETISYQITVLTILAKIQ